MSVDEPPTKNEGVRIGMASLGSNGTGEAKKRAKNKRADSGHTYSSVLDDDLDMSADRDSALLGCEWHENEDLLPTETFHMERKTRRSSSLVQPWAGKKLTVFDNIKLGAYWFGWAMLWAPLLVIIMPAQVASIGSSGDKGKSLGLILMVGSLSGVFFSPLFGAMSDRSKNPMGRRRPFMLLGIIVSTCGLVVMATSPPLFIYCLAFMVLSIGSNLIMAPYSALIPDVVPKNQRGVASGWLGGLSMLGYLLGGFVSSQIDVWGAVSVFGILSTVHLLSCLYTIATVPEVALSQKHPKFTVGECFREIMDPFSDPDFRWLFFSRFLVQMGCVTVQDFLQFYMADAVGVSSCAVAEVGAASVGGGATRHLLSAAHLSFSMLPALPLLFSRHARLSHIASVSAIGVGRSLLAPSSSSSCVLEFSFFGTVVATDEIAAVSILFLPLLLGAIVSSMSAGFLSDKFGGRRKIVIYVSGAFMAVACLLFSLTRSFTACIFTGVIFGLGYGAFSALDWALATDVLPCEADFGKDMGLWSVAMVLPQVVSAPINGHLLDVFNSVGSTEFQLGYTVIFFCAAVYFAVGAWLVKFITKTR